MRALNEEGAINISAQSKSNDVSSFSQAATSTNTQQDVQKAKSAGDVNLIVSGPDTSDDVPQQEINVGNGDTVQNAIASQANNELIQQGGSLKITGDGFGESKVYTKKSIEEARLKKMRKEGRVFTKKSLRESFMAEDATYDMIGKLPLFSALEAYKAVGGDLQALSTEWDVTRVVADKYNSLPQELKDKFMQVARGGLR